jgi:hypothetical protein
MGFGKGKPTVRVVSQPADKVGHRWLGVRKKNTPGATLAQVNYAGVHLVAGGCRYCTVTKRMKYLFKIYSS